MLMRWMSANDRSECFGHEPHEGLNKFCRKTISENDKNMQNVLINGPNPASFCLFSFFSQCKDKYSTNFTVVYGKSVNDVFGTQTRVA